jgi:hypothetical protein
MQQASWNLCPQKTAYSGSCYYSAADQTFSTLSGTSTTQIMDAPDGTWNLIVKRDIFNKVQGAVRDIIKLAAGSYYYKVSSALRQEKGGVWFTLGSRGGGQEPGNRGNRGTFGTCKCYSTAVIFCQ